MNISKYFINDIDTLKSLFKYEKEFLMFREAFIKEIFNPFLKHSIINVYTPKSVLTLILTSGCHF